MHWKQKLFITMIVLSGCTDGSPDPVDSAEAETFIRFAYLETPNDPTVPLCEEAASPDTAADTLFITCPLEGESFVDPVIPTEVPETITVVAYNLERGFKLEEQLALLSSDSSVPTPDILLVSEVDRGCARTGRRNVARDLAEGLGMNYIFAVEFVELAVQQDGSHVSECEHGNAILSKFPLGNAELLRHQEQVSWFNADESRLGGRVAVKADAQIGSTLVSLYSVHFESAISEDPRQHQAQEIAEHGLRADRLAIVGGDFNSGYLSLEIENGGQWDLTAEQFTDRGYVDAHDSLDLEERVTAPERGFILDLIMANQDIFTEAGVCQAAECTGLSDHQPVWAKIELP